MEQFIPDESPESCDQAPQIQPIMLDQTSILSGDLPSLSDPQDCSTFPDWMQVASIQDGGRTYQAYMPNEYDLPDDEEEQDRQDFQHAIYMMITNNRLATAPITSPENVLDIGTGTGIWALQFANHNPTSQIIGTDLSLIQPQSETTPNCKFVQHNSEIEDWNFGCAFDYVHLRGTAACFNDFMTVTQKAYRNMVPGGWIEVQDGSFEINCIDNTLQGTAFERFIHLITIGGARMNRDLTKAKFYKDFLTHSGFVDVREQKIWVPGTPWPGDPRMRRIGLYLANTFLNTIDSYRRFLTTAGLSLKEIEELTIAVQKDLQYGEIHCVFPVFIVYGRKPYDWELLGPKFNSGL